MEDVSPPPPAARSAAAPAARAWLTPRNGACVSVFGVLLVLLALPLPWFPPQHQGFEAVLWLTLGGRSGGGWIAVGTVIAVLIAQVSAVRQPGLPRPTWVLTGFLLVTLYLMVVLPGFWEAAGTGPDFVIAPGYWVALAGFLVILLGSFVRSITARRAQRQSTSSTTPHQAIKRRVRKPLGWGFLVGLFPLGLALVLLLTSSQLQALEFVVVAGVDSVAWIGTGLLRLLSPTQSSRAFARGLLITLLVTGGLGSAAISACATFNGSLNKAQLPTHFQSGWEPRYHTGDRSEKRGPSPTSPACCW